MLSLSIFLGLLNPNTLEVSASELEDQSNQDIVNET